MTWRLNLDGALCAYRNGVIVGAVYERANGWIAIVLNPWELLGVGPRKRAMRAVENKR